MFNVSRASASPAEIELARASIIWVNQHIVLQHVAYESSMILYWRVTKCLQCQNAPPKHIKQDQAVSKELYFTALTNMPTTPPTPAAQVCVCVSVCACALLCVFEMESSHSLVMRSLWSFSDTKSCARWGWALKLCQHPVWICSAFNNKRPLFARVAAQKGLDATKTISDRVPVSSSVPLWVSWN